MPTIAYVGFLMRNLISFYAFDKLVFNNFG